MEFVIKAEDWRKLESDSAIKSVEIGASVIEHEIEGEVLDEPAELARVMQLLDISAKFQEMAMKIVKGEAEKYDHL